LPVKPLVSATLALVLVPVGPGARAEQVVAEETASSGFPDVDVVAPVRIGWGYSRLFRSRILSLSFEDELQFHRLSRSFTLGAVFGMDAQRALDDVPRPRSFLATTLGSSVMFRPGHEAPAFVLSGTAAPLWQSSDETTRLVGFGVGARLEAWPFYQSMFEAVECRRGTVATYLLSGLHGWALARHDWIGTSGDSYAVGFGVELGRNMVLPLLGALLNASCAR
jgi:hypothetical protein